MLFHLLLLVWVIVIQVFPQLQFVIRVWYVMVGHFVVLIHFAHLVQLYCLVFVYGQVVHHILLGPTSQRCGQLFGSVFFMLEHLNTRVPVW